MRQAWMAGAVACILAAGGLQSEAAEVSASLDAVSAYVFRGETLNDGFVLQPCLEAGGTFPITLGVWGNLDLDDYDGRLDEGEFSEVDLYAVYAVPVEFMDLSLGYTEYLYPQGPEADREFAVTAGLDVLLSPSLTAAYGVDGAIAESLYLEGEIGHEFDLGKGFTLEPGATIGYVEPDEGESGFSHYTASLTASYKVISAGVTYVGRIDEDVLPDVEDLEDDTGYDVEVIGMLRIGTTY